MYIWLWKASNPSLNETKLFLVHHTYILVVQKREDQRKTVISNWHRQNMKYLPPLSSRHFGHSLPFFFSKFIKPANTIVPMDILSMTLIKIILWMVFVWKLLNWSKLMKIRFRGNGIHWISVTKPSSFMEEKTNIWIPSHSHTFSSPLTCFPANSCQYQVDGG